LKSLLAGPKYPAADPKKWLRKSNPKTDLNIDPNFLSRLAALAAHFKKPLYISSGYRSVEQQIVLYKKSGGKQDPRGNWFGGNGRAGKPGNSKHNFGLAVDVSSLWAKAIEQEESTADQKILKKFGLYKPMTRGNDTNIFENWHIQPIELSGQKPGKWAVFKAYYGAQY